MNIEREIHLGDDEFAGQITIDGSPVGIRGVKDNEQYHVSVLINGQSMLKTYIYEDVEMIVDEVIEGLTQSLVKTVRGLH